jgi:hypothetical protein
MPLLNIKTPGTYVTEIPAGVNNIEIENFNACYMIGHAAGGTVTTRDVATKVDSVADFVTKFGAASTSEKSVDAYFKNCGQGFGGGNAGILYFVNVTKAAAAPTAAEYATAIGKVFNRYIPKGAIIAPAAFEGLTVQADRVIVGNAMRDEAEKFNMLAIVDSGPSNLVNNYATIMTEQALYTSSRGHLEFWGGYLKDYQNRIVPTSPVKAGAMNRVYRSDGIARAVAGTKFVLRGITDVMINFSDSDQEVLTPAGCNVVRNLYGRGIVFWGARTKSNQVRTQFTHERVILNVLESTLGKAFDEFLFDSIGSQGELLVRIGDTLRDVCHRMWRGGAFFGTIPSKAYGVICNMLNNVESDLQNGIVQADVYVAITPVLELLFIQVRPTALGQVELAISIVTGESNSADEQAKEPNQAA